MSTEIEKLEELFEECPSDSRSTDEPTKWWC